MKIYSKLITLVVVFSLAISSCYNDNKEYIYSKQSSTTCDTTGISYSEDIVLIMNTNCTRCHAEGAQSPDLSKYNSVMSNATRLVELMKSGAMPKDAGPVTDCEISKMEAWIEIGTPNN